MFVGPAAVILTSGPRGHKNIFMSDLHSILSPSFDSDIEDNCQGKSELPIKPLSLELLTCVRIDCTPGWLGDKMIPDILR